MWDGNIGDHAYRTRVTSWSTRRSNYTPQNIVIGHRTIRRDERLSPVARRHRQRNLRTVTLNDVFAKPEATVPTSEYPD